MTAAQLAADAARVLLHASMRLNAWAVQRSDRARGRHRQSVTRDDVAAMVRAGERERSEERWGQWLQN